MSSVVIATKSPVLAEILKMSKPTENEKLKTALADETVKNGAGGLASKLFKDIPDMWWLRNESHMDVNPGTVGSGSDRIHCLFSPDYHANSYQRNLYRISRESGYRFSAIDANKVSELIHNLDTQQLPAVFHQHWLKEIFGGKGSDTESLASIQSYFNALRYLQSKGGKVIWTVHNLFDHDINDDERELNLICLKEMVGLADLIIVHSSNSVTELEKIVGHGFEDRVRILKHSLYDSMLEYPQFLPVEYRVRNLSPGLKFLMFGMLRPYKGACDLLQGFFTLVASGELNDATLIIAGKVYDPPLQKILRDNKELQDRVVVIDKRLSDTELASLCRAADVAVLPYRKILISGSYYQAVTFGLPCIVPDIGMFQCEVENGVTGIKYAQDGGLVAALKKAHSLGRKNLAAIGQRAVAGCDLQTERMISSRFKDLLESVASASLQMQPEKLAGGTLTEPQESDPIKLSFCIPVMNRLEDLRATLARNLEDNLESKGRVEFVVVCFDQDDEVEGWIKSEFKTELDDEYLRFYRADPLDFWHFGRAKSAFRELMRGRIYASLDGDNFTGFRGGEHIIEVFEAHNYQCVFHQFQGEWGDGTCGRVSLSREDYLAYGYDESFLPRQWDELDAMLSVLAQQLDRTYVCYSGKSIIDKSQPFRRFLEEHNLFPPTAELSPELDPLFSEIGDKSFGAHDNDYVRDDLSLIYSSIFNHLQSFFKNSSRDDLKVQYVDELVEVQRQLVDEIDPSILERWVLQCDTDLPTDISENDIVALACVKNELDLVSWHEYYKQLGVTRFLILDDGSDMPVKEILPFPDVHVWKPMVGQFRHAKVFWLEILLANYCSGLWCLTIDGDEFISLPDLDEVPGETESILRRCMTVAENSDEEYFCGFLLDMVPGTAEVASGQLERDSFKYYQYSPDLPDRDYQDHNTVSWSYGDKSDWAFRIDVRYSINASLDSLRKFPIIRYRKGMHLNQGFHDLIIDTVKRSSEDLTRTDLIPIVHFKLWVLSEAEDAEAAKGFDAYHHETSENLRSLIAGLDKKLSTVADGACIYPYLGYALIPTPTCQSIEVLLKYEEEGDGSDQVSLQRSRSFTFIESGEEVKREGYEISGPSSKSMVDWIRQMTPFTEVLEATNDVVILATGPKDNGNSLGL